jgi:hypothetical protein
MVSTSTRVDRIAGIAVKHETDEVLFRLAWSEDLAKVRA